MMIRCSAKVSAKRFVAPLGARAYNWGSLVTPFTPEEAKQGFQEIDSFFSQQRTIIASAPSSMPTINWQQYMDEVEDKAAVEAMKVEYEAALKASQSVSVEDSILEFERGMDADIVSCEAAAESTRAEIEVERAESIKLANERDTVGQWELEDFYKAIPGLKEELIEEMWQEKPLISGKYDEELEKFDPVQALEDLKQGVMIEIPKGIPQKIGDLDFSDIIPATEPEPEWIEHNDIYD